MAWWQTGIIYQIYPRSFQDSSGDGVGDLPGIRNRLPYLRKLGIDAIWLSPIFVSPMADFGYDIVNYKNIDPLFGTLADFDELLVAAHRLGIRLLLDLVPNHTSNQHPWFLSSRSSRASPKRDWYLWRDPKPGGGPPNNWLSDFGGSAWTFDRDTAQYYYHAFLAEQPDLNWRNPQVRKAIYDVMRFWLQRGVDGFRVDVIWHLIKDDQFRDNPPNPDFVSGNPSNHRLIPLYTADRPEVHDVIAEMRAVVDEFADRVLIGEIYLPIERLVSYYGRDLRGAQLPFNFGLLEVPWRAGAIANLIDEYEGALPRGGWPNWVLGNHDRPRIASRIGREQARIAAMLLLTLRGTPTIYYGDELGMVQVPIPIERIQDPLERNLPGIGVGRDGCRTPMQWDSSANAGFSNTEPWLPLAHDFRSENVDNQRRESASMLNLYRRLIRLRSAHAALSRGRYRPRAAQGNALLFTRELEDERLLVALNLGNEPIELRLEGAPLRGRIILSVAGTREGNSVEGGISLRGNDGLVIEMSDSA